ncbi:TRCF domain-containing protein [Sphingobium phenoxybenzoativorans]|uniref:TRCF domain-containing protein n=1 Tax=Sphingobium phenoxybenzoativorans TaxID=1592790 RepID=UPI0008730DA9|nr:TRCF domain-containing protein [Sphingobium phenoxybenzoativorans]
MTQARGLGETAFILWQALIEGDVLYLADDEQMAEATADALRALAPDNPVIFLPSSDALPGDTAPASPANVGHRVAALSALRRLGQDPERSPLATIMSGEAAARRYADPASFEVAPPSLNVGDQIDQATFANDMAAVGYVEDDRVDEPGEVSVRGDVIDIFPADAGSPARIEIADGTISAIRRYDPASQLSTQNCHSLAIGRALEPDVGAGTSILAHLPPGALFLSPKADARRQRFIRLAEDAARGKDRIVDAIGEASWAAALAEWAVHPLDANTVEPIPRFIEERSPLRALARFVKPLLHGRRLVLIGSERDIRFLRPRLAGRLKISLPLVENLSAATALAAGSGAALISPIDHGALTDAVLLVAAGDLLGSRALIDAATEPVMAALARSGGDIRRGDVVVHEDHGVGLVAGLEVDPSDSRSETIALEYTGGSRRLVPVREAARIWRYGADADAVSLDKLDGSSWQKRRSDIAAAVAENAQALLALAEERARLTAPILEPDPALYERFVSGFPFNETADQARAAQAVRDDLASGRPMDRLVIGDVGFGKTEIALRAAALAALAGYQVAVAAPTTVLVRQHLQTFEQRFDTLGIKLAGLSRLSTAAEKKMVKAGLADGSIAIVVGTGAVMGKDVRFARLGLVIIDEEQRFGAADKARLRGRHDVHLLAMSATPIPRTLHRAIIGLQQMSIIATPPARRQPIRTSLIELDDARLRTALLRERARGGQSFVVVPRIDDMAPFSERLQRIVPGLVRIEAHGKLPAKDIDTAMVRFAGGDGDILLATNIIEAGLDVPRANTMIVWRADRFGLAQLHQLRGRVGRGHRRGQVLLVTEGADIAARTMKRLRTLSTYDRLGAGFDIAAADLDQRGAGDPLSDTQAGHMKLIGVDLYQHLFEKALKQARGLTDLDWMPEIALQGAGALPEAWIPEEDIRLGLYVRIARAGDEGEIEAMEQELLDRFGPLPSDAQQLMALARIALLARMAGIVRVDAGPAAIALTPHGKQMRPPGGLGLIAKDGRWLLKEATEDAERSARVTELLEALGEVSL